MSRNPFSLYDFLGYVFPGAFALLLLFCQFHSKLMPFLIRIFPNLDSLKNIQMEHVHWLGVSVVFLVLSYIIGHIFSFLSSAIIEKFAVWMYGFPSYFLLNEVGHSKYWQINDESKDGKKEKSGYKYWIALLWRVMIGFFLLPISICSFLFGWVLNLRDLVAKPVNGTLKNAINSKIAILMGVLQIPFDSTADSTVDIYTIIHHYEFNHCEAHVKKIDNYVALSGFLRTLTLIVNSYFLYFFIAEVLLKISISSPFDWGIVLYFVILALLDYILFLGFMKFFRRSALESFMCLITDTSLLWTGSACHG